ncbi:Protein C53B4.3, partial [Aphelenchoides avenae]
MTAAYVTSTLVNTASFMQMVSLTYVAKDRGISDDTIGYIQSLAAFMQMVGGPIFSYWIQRYGLKSALLTCYLSCIISGITQHYSP